MYTGNGVTKKFPLPDGYTGDAVYLIFPTGKSIKMLKDEGYTVSEGAVYFSAAIPAGVIVQFTEPENVISAGDRLNYVVIYKDGRIVEVTEDPTELLVQTQKALIDAKTHYAEVKAYADDVMNTLDSLKDILTDTFEGLLYEYAQRGEKQISQNATAMQEKIQLALESAVLEIRREAQTVEAGLQVMELVKKDAQDAAHSAAQGVREELAGQIIEALDIHKKVIQAKGDCEYYYLEAQSAAQKAGLEVQAAMTQKANEELEMLRSLRLKLEDDREMLNARINSTIEVLRSGTNGR